MRLIPIFFIILCSIIGCKDKVISSSNIYIGTYRIADRIIPYPFIMKKEGDSIFLFNEIGECIDKTISEELKRNSLIDFKDKQFKILDLLKDELIVFDLKDTLNFFNYNNGNPNPKYAAKFKKLDKGPRLDLQKLKDGLQRSIWNHTIIEDEKSNPNHDLVIKQRLQFNNDSIRIITDYLYQDFKIRSEYESRAYSIFEIGGYLFLSFRKENDNPQPIFRITGYNSEEIQFEDYSSSSSKTIRFSKDSINTNIFSDLIANAIPFAMCYDGYQGEYYYEDITFNKGNEYIGNYVSKNIPTNETKSGYIIVHFTINCSGELGNFGLIQMDKKYKKSAFSKEIVSHIINKVGDLKDFPNPVSKRNWLQFKDVHGFLMFKLENGKIADVCP